MQLEDLVDIIKHLDKKGQKRLSSWVLSKLAEKLTLMCKSKTFPLSIFLIIYFSLFQNNFLEMRQLLKCDILFFDFVRDYSDVDLKIGLNWIQIVTFWRKLLKHLGLILMEKQFSL